MHSALYSEITTSLLVVKLFDDRKVFYFPLQRVSDSEVKVRYEEASG